MSAITLDHVGLDRGATPVLRDISLTLSKGEFVALVGPNGAGKSSLMCCALGALAPTAGVARLGKEDIAAMDPTLRARQVSYLPQSRPTAWPMLVEDIVALGLYAYGVGASVLSDANRSAIDEAINSCGLAGLRQRRADQLSGGELARTHCARAFVSRAPFLMVDEPTNSLDPAGQIDIMRLVKNHTRKGAGALVILHDINLAASFADRIIWMKDGKICAEGSPAQTITPERMDEVFSVSTKVSLSETAPHVIFDA